LDIDLSNPKQIVNRLEKMKNVLQSGRIIDERRLESQMMGQGAFENNKRAHAQL